MLRSGYLVDNMSRSLTVIRIEGRIGWKNIPEKGETVSTAMTLRKNGGEHHFHGALMAHLLTNKGKKWQ